jgi:hypothetical protein
VRGVFRPNCHNLVLSQAKPGRAQTASMPAAARPHCIIFARELGMLAFVFGLCRLSAKFGRLVVYDIGVFGIESRIPNSEILVCFYSRFSDLFKRNAFSKNLLNRNLSRNTNLQIERGL